MMTVPAVSRRKKRQTSGVYGNKIQVYFNRNQNL